MKKALVTAALGGALLLTSAVPAYAAPADHCLEPPYTESAPRCACIAVVTILRDVTGDPWMCAMQLVSCGRQPVADALSSVVPPSTWNCNFQ